MIFLMTFFPPRINHIKNKTSSVETKGQECQAVCILKNGRRRGTLTEFLGQRSRWLSWYLTLFTGVFTSFGSPLMNQRRLSVLSTIHQGLLFFYFLRKNKGIQQYSTVFLCVQFTCILKFQTFFFSLLRVDQIIEYFQFS